MHVHVNTSAWEFIPVLNFALTALPSKNATFCTSQKFPVYHLIPERFVVTVQT